MAQSSIQEVLDDGYSTYRLIHKSNWNKEAKKKAEKILYDYVGLGSIIFLNGDFTTDESKFYVPCGFNKVYIKANFNCMEVGGTEVYFIKNNDLDTVYVLRLVEANSEPIFKKI